MSNRACCTTMTSRGDDLAWRSSLDAYRPLSIQGSCDLLHRIRMRPQSVRLRKRWSTEEREIEDVRPLSCQTIQAMLLRVAYDLVGSGMPLSSRMAPSIRFNFEMWRSRSSRRFSALAHLGLALSKSGGPLRQPSLVLISIRTRQNRRPCSGLLEALAESGFFALGSHQSFANRAFDGC